MKNKFLFVAIFGIGVILGAIGDHVLVKNRAAHVQALPLMWSDTEEATLARMNDFEDRLNHLEKAGPDSIEALSKQAEAERGIEDILIKFREAKQAKYAPYTGAAGTVLSSMIGGIGGWLIARLRSKNTRKDVRPSEPIAG